MGKAKKAVKKEEPKKVVKKEEPKKSTVRVVKTVVIKKQPVVTKTLPERIDEIKNKLDSINVIEDKVEEVVLVVEVKQEEVAPEVKAEEVVAEVKTEPVVEVKPEPTWQEIHDAEILAKVAREK